SNGKAAEIVWSDNAVRIDSFEQQNYGYIILRGGRMYAVTFISGKPIVLDMSNMDEQLSSIAQSMGRQGISGDVLKNFRIDSVKDLGKTRTVAGIEGNVYAVTITDANGTPRKTTMVLTNDPLVTEMTKTLLHRFLQASDTSKSIEQVLAKLPDNQYGLL